MKTSARIFNISTTIFLFILLSSTGLYSQNEQVEKEILNNTKIIRQAFSDGDIEKIKSLHHPEVVKALGYNDVKIGRDEVILGITGLLENYKMEFIKNEVENILIQDNIVIIQGKFSLKGTSKTNDDSFTFSGRTLVTYIRYDKSPTGWATIREIIQPETE